MMNLDHLALVALGLVDKIDAINAETHPGGDVQRRAKIQVAIIETFEPMKVEIDTLRWQLGRGKKPE